MFGGGDRRPSGIAVDCVHAREVDHPAPAALHHGAAECPAQVERTVQVCVHHPVPVGVGHLQEGLLWPDGGVVHDDRDRRHLGFHPFLQLGDLLGASDIGHHHQRLASDGADIRGHRVAGFPIGAAVDDDVETVPGERHGDSAADILAGTGNDGGSGGLGHRVLPG